ncbi:tyrosine-type recombinase/integrase [Nonomuraea sp. NPDC003709]|uniref:tyrosine-type recombinase/integrase n=1 Tax=Nonomuraea sp. NPDC003709 TaxID=3154450 RepID=UPI0033A66A43
MIGAGVRAVLGYPSLSGKIAITGGTRAGRPSLGAQASFSGYLATWRMVEAGTVDPVIAEQLGRAHPLAAHLNDFLTDLANAGASAHTRRAYRGDLIAFAAHHGEELGELTAAPVRAFLAELAELSPAGRKRKRAAVASFAKWAIRHDLLQANPMDRIDTVKVPKSLPRPAAAADVAKVLAVICPRRPRKDLPLDRLRDRVLFETAYVCGARASEVCGLYVEDLDLRLDDEHVRVHGKGGSVLLDDRGYVTLLKLYLARAGYSAGPLFRASINGCGGPLSYDAAHHRWQSYCAAAGVEIDIHQLRHAHASELVNAGCPSRQFAAASATPLPRPPSCTRCWTTRSPTPRSAPPADAATKRSADDKPLRDGFVGLSAIATGTPRAGQQRNLAAELDVHRVPGDLDAGEDGKAERLQFALAEGNQEAPDEPAGQEHHEHRHHLQRLVLE